jgi:hypothetical protein
MTWEPLLPKFVLPLKSFSGIEEKESYPAAGTHPPHAALADKTRRSSSGAGRALGLHSKDWQDVMGNYRLTQNRCVQYIDNPAYLVNTGACVVVQRYFA